MSEGSFLDGFADGALSGAITGAITGAAFAGIGVAGSALGNFLGGSCKFANCASKILNVLKCTSKVTGVLTLGMGAFDSLSMIVGIFDPDNPLVVFNQKLHSSSLYNTFQIGVSVLAVFSGSAYMSMQNRMKLPPTCFVAGTMILTASGLVAIENIKVGDKVISTNPDTFETAEKTVVETYIREVPKLVRLTINKELITTTEDHPFYVKEHGFINASELLIGDKVVNASGEIYLVENIYVETSKYPVTVYNFQVEDFHTYYVGNNEIFVHNADCGGRYADLKKTSDSSKEQVHHIPADSASPLSKSDGVSIKMEIADHQNTASFDNKAGSRSYRRTQAKLIKEGKFKEAFKMDVKDIKSNFGNKYDKGIAQAEKYLEKLISEGKVK